MSGRCSSEAPLVPCGAYVGDNDGTCPQLTCIRARGHVGPHDNTSDECRREVIYVCNKREGHAGACGVDHRTDNAFANAEARIRSIIDWQFGTERAKLDQVLDAMPPVAKRMDYAIPYPDPVPMRRDDLRERLCALLDEVWRFFDPKAYNPNDCACAKTDNTLAAAESHFRHTTQSLRWIEQVVRRELKRAAARCSDSAIPEEDSPPFVSPGQTEFETRGFERVNNPRTTPKQSKEQDG